MARYITYLLRTLHTRLTTQDQIRLSSSLASAANRLHHPIDLRDKMLGLPILLSVLPCPVQSSDAPFALPKKTEGGPVMARFIYTPIQAKFCYSFSKYSYISGSPQLGRSLLGWPMRLVK